MPKPKAFIFDMNGTMINDMPFHIRAWHKIFNSNGANFSMERSKLECYGSNHEILERIFPNKFSQAEKDAISIIKETAYQQAYQPHLKLINGLDVFLQKASESNIKMGIGSAAIMFNVNFIVDGLNIRHYFGSLISADDVAVSKPNPQTFLKVAEQLGINPKDCIVFEDSPKGVQAATAAGMSSVVLTTMHTREEFTDENILFFVEDYTNSLFEKLMQ
jgi:beta-phosphoglucomutase